MRYSDDLTLPFFTLQLSPQGPAYIGVSQARRAALESAGLQIPNPALVQALIDTGASCTCVDPSILSSLSLTPTGKASVNTPSTGVTPHVADQYDVSLMVPGSLPTQLPLVVPTLPVVCTELHAAQNFHVLIGRDVLGLCLLEYNGLSRIFTVAY